jgi:hypothetical protein
MAPGFFKPVSAGWVGPGALVSLAVTTTTPSLSTYNKDGSGNLEWFDSSHPDMLYSFSSTFPNNFSYVGQSVIYSGFSTADTFKINAYCANFIGDEVDLDIDFLDANGDLVLNYAVATPDFLYNVLKYSTNGVDYTTAPTTGSYPQAYGTFSFTDTAITFTKDSWQADNYVNTHSVSADFASVRSVRIKNPVIAVSNNVGAKVLLRFGKGDLTSSDV